MENLFNFSGILLRLCSTNYISHMHGFLFRSVHGQGKSEGSDPVPGPLGSQERRIAPRQIACLHITRTISPGPQAKRGGKRTPFWVPS